MNRLFLALTGSRRLLMITLALSLLMILAACGGGQPSSPTPETQATNADQVATTDTGSSDSDVVPPAEVSPQVEVVQNYLTAKVSNNDERLRLLLCAERESDYEMESTSFDSVTEARIENMSCAAQSDELVVCSGQIVAVYGGENQDFPLGAYRVVQEDGEWKWCGEAATENPLPGTTAEAIGE